MRTTAEDLGRSPKNNRQLCNSDEASWSTIKERNGEEMRCSNPTSHPSPSGFKISRCGRPARAAPALLSVCPDGRFHLETRSEMVPNAPFAIDVRRRIPDLQQT